MQVARPKCLNSRSNKQQTLCLTVLWDYKMNVSGASVSMTLNIQKYFFATLKYLNHNFKLLLQK